MSQQLSQNMQAINKLRTLWHPLCYRLMKVLLVPTNASVRDEFPIINESPKSDMVLRHEGEYWTKEQQAVLPDGIRNRHLQHHQLELKITESLSANSFKQALMYDFLYPQKVNIKDHEFQTYIICSKTPQKKRLAAWGYEQDGYPGVYASKLPLLEDIVVLVLNQLQNMPHNNYFQLFASDRKVRASAFEYVLQTFSPSLSDDRIKDEILSVVFALGTAYDLEMEGVEMTDKMTIDRLLEMGDGLRQTVIAAASLEDRLSGLKPEERIMGLKPEELFRMFTPEMRVMGLKPEERVMGLKPEERVMGLKPEERVIGLKPAERLSGLSREDKRMLIEELERSLQMENSSDEALDEVATVETDADSVNTIESMPDKQISEKDL